MRKLEIIALNGVDAKAAEDAGADRIELVSEMAVGGLSPAIEIVREVIASVSIPVNVMVRFEHESFKYDEDQFKTMLSYIEEVKDLGINGLVFGSLDSAGIIDEGQLSQIVEAAGDLDITYHRAIDESYDNYKSNMQTISGKVTTVLTSGGTLYPITENIELLQWASELNVQVLVGGGINNSNYKQMFDNLPNCHFHIGSLAYNNGDFTAGINHDKVVEVKSYLN